VERRDLGVERAGEAALSVTPVNVSVKAAVWRVDRSR
jgi:hypothetical protein